MMEERIRFSPAEKNTTMCYTVYLGIARNFINVVQFNINLSKRFSETTFNDQNAVGEFDIMNFL